MTPLIAGSLPIVSMELSGEWRETFIEPSLLKLLIPITFTIWGPIFILMAAFVFYQARDLLPEREEINMPYVHQVSVFFLFSSLLTSLWYARAASMRHPRKISTT